MTVHNRWQWVKDRLSTVSTWRLLWGLVMPVGFAVFWFVANLRQGEAGWTVFWGLLLGISIVIELAAMTLRISRRRQE